MDHKFCIILVLLQIQIHVYECEAIYCQEAVASVALVGSCPTSEIEWDTAARRKNCSSVSSYQNCSTVEKFQYHCVINGYRNETLEVCAPSRIIFGHCVEFNLLGGFIQDQWSSPCNDIFPKCDAIYISTAAYTYPDCYKLVSMNEDYPTTEEMPVRKKDVATTNKYFLIISITLILPTLILIPSAVVMVIKRRRPTPESKENLRLTSTGADQAQRDIFKKEPIAFQPSMISDDTIPQDKEIIEDNLID